MMLLIMAFVLERLESFDDEHAACNSHDGNRVKKGSMCSFQT